MKKDIKVVLFDFDGVIMDTEPQYTQFWQRIGAKYYPNNSKFAVEIKGSTLFQIFNKYFKGKDILQQQIVDELKIYEAEMQYDYISGFISFLSDLKKNKIKTAVVSSSNEAKMNNVFRAHPEFNKMFNLVLLAENFKESKPNPECFLLAAEKLGVSIDKCVVFEDSFNGLEAGRRAKMSLIALATTNPFSSLCNKADFILEDFVGFTYEKMLKVV